MPTVDQIDIQVSASASNAEQKLLRLVTALQKVGTALNSVNLSRFVSSMREVQTSADNAAKALDRFAKAAQKAKAAADGMDSKHATEAMGDLERGANRATVAFTRMSTAIMTARNAISGFRGLPGGGGVSGADAFARHVQTALRNQMPRLSGSVGSQGILTEFVDNAEEEVERARISFGKIFSKIKEVRIPFSALSNSFKLVARGTKTLNSAMIAMPRYFGGRLISRVKDATKGMNSFFASIKRVAFYRAIRTALKIITQGISQGIANMYNWSKTSDGVFAASMDRLASSSQYLSNSLGAMAAPLINSLAPAIEYIIDRIVALINMINMLFAILSGSGTYTVATKTAAGWGKAAKGAGGAAKEVKKTLLAFDELNKLTDNSGGGGGSGGGGAGGLNFEQRTVNEWLKNAIETGNWFAIGQAIANKINETLDAIDWNQIKKKAVGFARGIANLINGFISDIDPKIIGKTIGEVINTGASYISTLWGETNWEGLGSVLKQTIITAINTIDGQTLASALMGRINAAVKFLKGLLPETYEEWKLVVGSLIGWLKLAINQFPKDSIAEVITRLINGALALITEIVNGGTLTDLISAIETTIKQAIEGVNKQALWDAFEAVLKAIFTWAVAAIDLTFKIGSVNPAAGAILAGIVLFRSGLMKLFGHFLFKRMFTGGVKLGTLAKGMAVIVGISVMAKAAFGIKEVLDNKEGMSDTDFVKALMDKIGDFLIGAGFAVAPFNLAAGGIIITVGLLIKFAPKIVEDVEKVARAYLENLGGGGNYGYSFTGVPMEQELGDRFGQFGANLGSLYDKYSNYTQDQYEQAAIMYWNLTHNPDGTLKTNTATDLPGSGRSEIVGNTTVVNNYYYNNAGATLTPTSTTKNPTNGQTVHYTNTSLFTAAEQEVTVSLKPSWVGSAVDKLGLANLKTWVAVNLGKGDNWYVDVVKKNNRIQVSGPSVSTTQSGGNAERDPKLTPKALGGSYYGGIWHSIPQYAGGTLNAYGSLFLAGEAGPELVGHVGGRTEVLNKSQLASAMFSAVRSAMAPVAVGFASAAASLRGYNEEDMAEMLDLVRTGNETRQAQNAILREQTQYLREINDKDFTADVTTASINKAQARMNRRAGVTVSPVGL